VTQDSLLSTPSGVSQSGRMSSGALALAIGLHLAVAGALWWISPLRTHDQAETPIMVTVEPEPLGATAAGGGGGGGAPAAEIPAPPTEAATAAPEPPQPTPSEPSQPPQQAMAAAEPSPPVPADSPSDAKTPADPQTTWQTDASAWKPQVTFEQALPAPDPPPPPTSRDIPKPQRAAPPPRPVQRAQTAVPPRPAPPPAAAPSPAPGNQQAAAGPSLSPNPGPSSADLAAGQGGMRNDYLSRVFRHIEPHRVYPAVARENRQSGRVVTRVTINRDGYLVDVRIDRSSGWPAIDAAEIAAIRRAMPLPPVPNGMPGDPIVLILPMNYGVR